MKDTSGRVSKTIRMREDVYYQARVAAVVTRKTLGQWIEEALLEKLEREAIGPEGSLKGEPDISAVNLQG